MSKKAKVICVGLLLTITVCITNAWGIAVRIHFSNDTTQPVVRTIEPYVDNYSAAAAASDEGVYRFDLPQASIEPEQPSNQDAKISYFWDFSWYGMSQYAYNYAGRSPKYGCFITELCLSARWWEALSYNIVIASYRPDPDHLDDYLICDVDRDSFNYFTVHFKSIQASTDSKADDSKRYSISGDQTFLTKTDYYHIDKPIPLWVDQEQKKALVIKPNQPEPELIASDFLNEVVPLPANTRIITVINYTGETLVAGPPLLDKFSQLSKQYYLDQPAEIKAGEAKRIKMAVPDFGYFATARLNYYIQGYSAEKPSGCYITVVNGNGLPNLITSYLFHPEHLLSGEKNLYCAVSLTNPQEEPTTVAIYDDMTKFFTHPGPISYSACNEWHHGCREWEIVFHHDQQLSKYSCDMGYIFPLDPVHSYIFKHIDCDPPPV